MRRFVLGVMIGIGLAAAYQLTVKIGRDARVGERQYDWFKPTETSGKANPA